MKEENIGLILGVGFIVGFLGLMLFGVISLAG